MGEIAPKPVTRKLSAQLASVISKIWWSWETQKTGRRPLLGLFEDYHSARSFSYALILTLSYWKKTTRPHPFPRSYSPDKTWEEKSVFPRVSMIWGPHKCSREPQSFDRSLGHVKGEQHLHVGTGERWTACIRPQEESVFPLEDGSREEKGKKKKTGGEEFFFFFFSMFEWI